MLSSPRGSSFQEVAAANMEYDGDGAFHSLRRTEPEPEDYSGKQSTCGGKNPPDISLPPRMFA
jgi:hypothetical protein